MNRSKKARQHRGIYNAPTDYSRGCSGKKQFASRHMAVRARAQIRKSDEAGGLNRPPVSIYRCKNCGYLHVGHDSRRMS